MINILTTCFFDPMGKTGPHNLTVSTDDVPTLTQTYSGCAHPDWPPLSSLTQTVTVKQL